MSERKIKKLSERVKAKLVQEGDCLIWKGAMVGQSPVIGVRQEDGSYRNLNIRAFRGTKIYEGTTLTTIFKTSCGNPRCVAKEHIILGSPLAGRTFFRAGAKKNLMDVNKKIFDLAVTMAAEDMADEVGLAPTAIRKILAENTAMYPYFTIRLAAHCNLEDVKAFTGTQNAAREYFNISQFAWRFVKGNKMQTVRDEEMYIKLLDECEVRGPHLVWVGDTAGGTPVSGALGSKRRDAFKLLVAAVHGGSKSHLFEGCSCGFEGCINPFHVGGAK